MTIEMNRGSFRTAWSSFDQKLHALLRDPEVRRVCEVGGGANPKLSLEDIQDLSVQYTVLDISQTELAKAPSGYHTIVADIGSPRITVKGPYDLVFSQMLAEHIAHPTYMHANIHAMLRPGGIALHFFPTLFDPAFIINRLTPERLSVSILHRLQDDRDNRGFHGKFPAYYRWCRGPTQRQIQRLEAMGYNVLSYSSFYGTSYLDRISLLRPLNRWLAHQFLRSGSPYLTSFAIVVLQREY
jgi:uncharacterized UPF0146 family protein